MHRHLLKLRTFILLSFLCTLGNALCAQSVSRQAVKSQLSPSAMTGESATGAETAFVDWTRRNAVPLKTVEAGNGFADMAGIGKIVGDARIVALGEATHGSREFFQLKHRIIEYLATQKNFTVFAIEANMPEAYRLNDYVLHGEGNPKQLLKGMYFWTWNTQEVLDLVLWMREYNRSGKGHVEFTGFDMQNPKLAMEIVQNFIAQQEPSYAGEVAQSYADVMQAVRGGSDANASKEKVAARCAAIVKHLEDRRATYEKQASPRDVEWATQMARIVCQATQMATGEKSRDASMSENVQWIAEQSRGGKLILWAHNGHITYEGYSYDSMGSHLRKIFGDKIVNFGFKFNEGSFRAYGTDHKLQVFTIGPAPDGSLDHALASTGLPVFALDVRKLPGSGTVGMWAAKSRLSRSIGAVYSGPDDPSSLVESPVHCMFDVLLFVDKTTAARAN